MFPLPYLLPFLLCAFCAQAQYRYLPLKRTLSGEAFGTSPGVQLIAETPFRYRKSHFLSLQAGLGLYRQVRSISIASQALSLSSGLTHCLLLNRRQTTPRPEHHRLETYLEAGLSGSLYPYRFKLSAAYPHGLLAGAQGLIGFRFHYLTRRQIYVCKLRYSPFVASGFPPWGGIAFGWGAW